MLTIHNDIVQGSDEWRALRCGLLTASEVKHIITPSMRFARDDAMRAHACEILAQRITGHVDPGYIGDDMLRGQEDEAWARELYSEHHSQVEECGFMIRSFGGFNIGYSPDGLVGDDGLIEFKSRKPKLQIETIVAAEMPAEHMQQVQTGLLVSGREWCDYVSYCGGLPMAVYRVDADKTWAEAIIDAAEEFEGVIAKMRLKFDSQVTRRKFRPTERRVEQEMII